MSLASAALMAVEPLASLAPIVAWCGSYLALHELAYRASLRRWPAVREGPGKGVDKGVDLDEPLEKCGGSTLRRVSAARVAALTHAVASCAWSAAALWRAWPQLRLARTGTTLWGLSFPLLAYDAPNAVGRGLMRHSLGYFVQELAHVLLREPDPIYVAHHVLYLSATLPICLGECGWPLIAVATVFAEATNPLQITWEMARAHGYSETYEALSAPFTAAFTFCRGLMLPLAVVDMGTFLFHPSLATHRSGAGRHTMIWTWSLFVLGLGASLLWLSQVLSGFFKHRRKKHQQPRTDKGG